MPSKPRICIRRSMFLVLRFVAFLSVVIPYWTRDYARAFSTSPALAVTSTSASPAIEYHPRVISIQNYTTFHLLSLPPLSESSSKIIRDVWKWKDIALGDGRDYFVPRPRALKALSDLLVGTGNTKGFPVNFTSSSSSEHESKNNTNSRQNFTKCGSTRAFSGNATCIVQE